MDIFDVLKAVAKRKMEFVCKGMKDDKALDKAEFDVSNEYHISLRDIRKLYKASY